MRTRRGLTCALALGLLTFSTSTALGADSLTVSLPTTSPVRGIPLTATFSGSDTPIDEHGSTPFLYALVRPVNGVPCQPTFGADLQVSGTTSVTELYDSGNNDRTVSSGNYSYSSSITPLEGAYVLCAWLETDSDDYRAKGDTSSVVTASAMASYTTQNTDLLGISLPTVTPVKGIPITVSFSGHDTPVTTSGGSPFLYALARESKGIPCQPTFGADLQVSGSATVTELYDSNNNGQTVSSGSYSYSVSLTPAVGTYVVCAWLETDSNDYRAKGDTPSVVTASTSVGYSVSPPIVCVVPSFAGATLAQVRQRLASHHCGVGHVRRLHRRHTRHGRVLGLSVSPGSRHRAGYPVGITVSH